MLKKCLFFLLLSQVLRTRYNFYGRGLAPWAANGRRRLWQGRNACRREEEGCRVSELTECTISKTLKNRTPQTPSASIQAAVWGGAKGVSALPQRVFLPENICFLPHKARVSAPKSTRTRKKTNLSATKRSLVCITKKPCLVHKEGLFAAQQKDFLIHKRAER